MNGEKESWIRQIPGSDKLQLSSFILAHDITVQAQSISPVREGLCNLNSLTNT
jgi:hypothetical protein